MQTKNYDIIICGGGMAGLSLVYRALKEKVWVAERILIIDKDSKDKNDRTWCFWQKEGIENEFEDVVYKRWKDFLFFSNKEEKLKLDTGSYIYKMIRSIDFYKHVLAYIRQFDQVDFVFQDIISIGNHGNKAAVKTSESVFESKYIFNSIYKKPELKPENQYFIQHFKGITIRTNQFKTDPAEMYFMDFRTTQENGTTFFYTLPFNQNEIFVEYTLFSKSLLKPEEYNSKIKIYLSEILRIDDFEIIEEEFGAIPMTDFSFERRSGNVINIGSVGGDTRASTGYTFLNTQKTISKILDSFKENNHPFFEKENISNKHKVLDATILNVLDNEIYKGDQIFTDLFNRVKAKTILAFLDGESTIPDDLKIMASLKAKYFIGPFLKVITR
ncbi:lycopene cyclase family protein [Dyadobacter frigoris]|uniref:Lycopene cyclase n=1 Tax=Dyadobacter frigoris TaxID=2576211 RepID=A0A4U6D465_9BACT|nr:lycopene cyclase family protein [Dyadobacter frigoris]TKT90951.1 lycopene cyclase [Dyadobacter frigoris]GLU56138.1 lycopene cyclase [Dyadobacter frigoris]